MSTPPIQSKVECPGAPIKPIAPEPVEQPEKRRRLNFSPVRTQAQPIPKGKLEPRRLFT
jgi:hypothetical protein